MFDKRYGIMILGWIGMESVWCTMTPYWKEVMSIFDLYVVWFGRWHRIR